MSNLETAELESDRIDDGAEVLDDDPADPWEGPHTEYDRYGHPTGAAYVRCRSCGIEAVTSTDTDTVGHRDGCRFEEVEVDAEEERADGRPEPARSEPADFGGGSSTGVQNL